MSAASGQAPPAWERYTRRRGRVPLTGLEALVRLPVDQVRRDRAAGRRVAALVSGYPGGPLAGLDRALRAVEPLLAEHDVKLAPALNDALACGSLAGTQLLDRLPHGDYDGVIGLWHGSGAGLERALSALRPANLAGTSRHGGVLALVGDDPSGASSPLPTDSGHACAHAGVPLLAPADAGEALELGLAGLALSRYAGVWVALQILPDVAAGGGLFELPDPERRFALPKFEVRGHPFAGRLDPRLLPPHSAELERELVYERLEAARRFAYANELDCIPVRHPRDRIGLVASGPLFRELETALERLGLDEVRLAALGVRLLHLRLLHPLEPRRVLEFADGLDEIVVVGDRSGLLEQQLRAALCNAVDRPLVWGQRDERGEPWLARDDEVTAETLARDLGEHLAARLDAPELGEHAAVLSACRGRESDAPARTPYFCSGCPHAASTRLPEGAVAGGGIGCHALALLMDRGVAYVAPPGTEGAHWLGLAPYVDTPHAFQNLGDGSYFHSGRLAVRAAVEAGANLTFKLLYNGSAALTGGQRAAGAKPLVDVVRDLLSDGVRSVRVVTRDGAVGELAARDLRVELLARSAYGAAVRRIQNEPGVTAIVFDQPCALERQRLERRGIAPRGAERIVIDEDVCEGCGDCAARSICPSLRSVERPLGRKVRVHPGSCSDDRSCLEGDCPAFLTVAGGWRRRRPLDRWLGEPLTDPLPLEWSEGRYEILLVGVGSAGIVTANALLARAAEIEGLWTSHLDQTGLAQRGGEVVSHCVLSRHPLAGSPRVGWGRADLVLGFDPLGAAGERGLRHLDPERTRVVLQRDLVPTSEMVASGEGAPDVARLLDRVRALSRETFSIASEALAEAALGESLHANVVLLGCALQLGLLPLSPSSLERAIRDRGVAAEANLLALRLGRAVAADPGLAGRVLADFAPPALGDGGSPEATGRLLGLAWDRFDEVIGRFVPSEPLEELRCRVAGLAADLVDYADRAWAERYLRALTRLARTEASRTPGSAPVTEAAARELYRLMAYKDEYEVARLLLRGPFRRWLDDSAEGRVRVRYHLHPPLLRALGLRRKLALGSGAEALLRGLVRLRGLRGGWLDPFGHTQVRRLERGLVPWYEGLLEALAEVLRPETAERVAAIAGMAGEIRGFEALKLRRADEVRTRVRTALDALGGARGADPTSGAGARRAQLR